MHDKAKDSLLYLDGVSVSFDGFKALNELSMVIEPGEMRAIIGPNGAGKTTMMDVVTGKTQARLGRDLLQRHRRPHPARRGGDRAARHRTEVPEADGLRESHRPRESRPRARRPPRHRRGALQARDAAGQGTDRGAAGADPPLRPAQPSRRLSQPRPEAVAGDRHAARPGAETAPRRRAGGRHDRRRDRGDGASSSATSPGRNR